MAFNKNTNLKRIIHLVFLSFLLAVPVLAAGARGRGKWLNTNIDGNILSSQPRLEDDFFQGVNYDFLKNTPIPEGKFGVSKLNSSFESIQDKMISYVKEIKLEEDNNLNKEKKLEDKALRYIYNQCSNWEKRNALGVEPILPVLKKFQNIQTISDFEKLLNDDEARWFVPFESGYFVFSAWNIITFDLSYLFDEKILPVDKRFSSDFYEKMLIKCGYSQDEAKQLVKTAQDFEGKYSGTEVKTSKQLYKANPDPQLACLPIRKFMDASGFEEASTISILGFERVEKFFSVYDEDNLESLKALCICKLMRDSALYLDSESYELECEISNNIYGKNIVLQNDEYAMNFLDNSIPMLYGKIWLQNFFSEEVRTDVTNLVQSILDEYIQEVPDWDWLSSGARYNLVQLLKRTKVIAGYSNSFPDYSQLYYALSKKEVNGRENTLFDSIIKIKNFEKAIQVKKSFDEVDYYAWVEPPQTVNAYYNNNNSINIFAGWLWWQQYDVNMSIEEKFAKVGVIMAHEISHSFSNELKYDDSTGHSWNKKDMYALEQKLTEFGNYLSQFTIINETKCDGDLVKYEAGADMFGFKVIMNMAKKIPDFDYRSFFISYSGVWCTKFTKETYENYLLKDVHPTHFLRVNAVVQQFDEFYEAFNIKKGDGMYLPPKKRIRF